MNQPEEYIRLEAIRGDNYTVLDSALAINGKVHFELANDAHTGIYRLAGLELRRRRHEPGSANAGFHFQ